MASLRWVEEAYLASPAPVLAPGPYTLVPCLELKQTPAVPATTPGLVVVAVAADAYGDGGDEVEHAHGV